MKSLTWPEKCKKPGHRLKMMEFREIRNIGRSQVSKALNKGLDFFLRAVGHHWKVTNRRESYMIGTSDLK